VEGKYGGKKVCSGGFAFGTRSAGCSDWGKGSRGLPFMIWTISEPLKTENFEKEGVLQFKSQKAKGPRTHITKHPSWLY